MICPKCGSERAISRGDDIQCKDCGKYSKRVYVPERETKEVEYGDDYIRVVTASRRIRSVEDAIREFHINTDEWEVKPPIKIKTSEGYRKDRMVKWKVRNGTVIEGDVDDTGNMLVVPLYHITVLFVRKVHEIRAREAVDKLIKDAVKHIPRKSKKIHPKGEYLYEVDFPDLHFGKLTWAEESGDNYDIRIARKMVRQAVDELIGFSELHKIKRILLPLGNDFFNVDSQAEETTHGTPQQEDTRYQKTFRAGREIAVDIIDSLAALAPVDVLVIPGNHDEERMFYLGDSLVAWYHNDANVMVDNAAMKRKYYAFGKVLIGLTHGYWEKVDKLPFIMPVEKPDLWAASLHREWHLGDKHHKSDMLMRTKDSNGVTVRILRSLSATDTWSFDKGYIGTPRSAEAFLWHPNDGLVAQYNVYPDVEEE